MSPRRELLETLRGHLARGAVSGAVVLVAHGDEVVVDALGLRRDTLFRIASMIKPVTAAATLLLVADGALGLDDAVDRWLPELAERRVLRDAGSPLDDTVAARRAITVRDLLTLRLGLGATGGALGKAMEAAGVAPSPEPIRHPPDEYLRRLAALPLAHHPGERWLYHTGLDVAGILVARVAGAPLAEVMRARIFAPLGMHDTGFWLPADKLARLATCTTDGGAVWAEDRDWSRPPRFESGGGQGGALLSTADDFLAFARELLPSGRLLPRALVEEMTRDQIPVEQKAASPFFPGFWDDLGWGLGLSITLSSGRFGWSGGTGPTFFVDPRADVVAIQMVQRLMTSPEAGAIIEDFTRLAWP